MPKYTYKCKECDEIFEVSHSMSERLTDCENCDTINSLAKIPAQIAVQYKKESGKVVDEYIEQAKQEVSEEKERLKEQDWKT